MNSDSERAHRHGLFRPGPATEPLPGRFVPFALAVIACAYQPATRLRPSVRREPPGFAYVRLCSLRGVEKASASGTRLPPSRRRTSHSQPPNFFQPPRFSPTKSDLIRLNPVIESEMVRVFSSCGRLLARLGRCASDAPLGPGARRRASGSKRASGPPCCPPLDPALRSGVSAERRTLSARFSQMAALGRDAATPRFLAPPRGSRTVETFRVPQQSIQIQKSA